MLVCGLVSSPKYKSLVTLAFAATVHVYMVPVGTMLPEPLLGITSNVVPLQIVAVCAVTNGFGLTVIVVVNVDPVHEPDTGVTV